MPRKTLKQRRERDEARSEDFGFDNAAKQAEDNRVRQYLSDLNSRTNDPEDMMLEIMEALNDTVSPIPEIGKFYTFVYNAKTPGESYDQHPLIACVGLFQWGFRGLNFHWQRYRNYTWAEVVGKLHVVEYQELDELLALQYGKFLLNK